MRGTVRHALGLVALLALLAPALPGCFSGDDGADHVARTRDCWGHPHDAKRPGGRGSCTDRIGPTAAAMGAIPPLRDALLDPPACGETVDCGPKNPARGLDGGATPDAYTGATPVLQLDGDAPPAPTETK